MMFDAPSHKKLEAAAETMDQIGMPARATAACRWELVEDGEYPLYSAGMRLCEAPNTPRLPPDTRGFWGQDPLHPQHSEEVCGRDSSSVSSRRRAPTSCRQTTLGA
jgi:hypothetical protein